jgi:hypothetical protein
MAKSLSWKDLLPTTTFKLLQVERRGSFASSYVHVDSPLASLVVLLRSETRAYRCEGTNCIVIGGEGLSVAGMQVHSEP